MTKTDKPAGVEFLDNGERALHRPGNGNEFALKRRGGIYFHEETPETVIAVLLSSRANGTRIRLHYGDTETGRDWMEEYGMSGTVGKSLGILPIPLMISTRKSYGGVGILDHCIVKITTTTAPRTVLYQHPLYQQPKASVRPIEEGEKVGDTDLVAAGYTHAVDVNGNRQANFKGEAAAKRYILNMGFAAA